MSGFSLFPDSASTLSHKVDFIYFLMLAISVFLTALIFFLIVGFGIKYRRGSKANRANPPSHNTKLEVFWIVVPLLGEMAIFAWGTYVYLDMYKVPKNAADIYVQGRQWMWELRHPEGKREINELHVPVGRAVRLLMSSDDVIHSFYVPAFRIKQDVVPGRYSSLWFEATKPGKYHLFCAEYCGTKHSGMIGWIYVMPQSDFQDWLEGGKVEPTMAASGEKLFRRYGCSGCHASGSSVRAPLLEGVYGKPVPLEGGQIVTADERYIRDSILLPKSQVVAGYQPVMPTFEGQVSEGDLLQIIAYIKSLANTEALAQ